MNPEDQRIAIAEACGWVDMKRPSGIMVSPRKTFLGNEIYEYPPDYLNDLNAMHQAEKVLRCGGENNQYDQYTDWLRKELGQESISATAAQRAEAFLRTIGKWKD